MEFLLLKPVLGQLLLATFLGAFLGLGREHRDELHHQHGFMGLRTMTLLALLGAVSTLFPVFPFLPIAFFVMIGILLAIVHAHGSFKMDRIGITSEITGMLTFWIGVMVGHEMQLIAILLTLFLAFLNTFRDGLRLFAWTLTDSEWHGALKLFLLSGAILPFLPRVPVDPWGALVPFNVWLIVVLISGLGFLGYFLIKYLGTKGGVPLMGFLGALVSSIGVTTALSVQSKKASVTTIFTVGILIATATMQLRVAGEIFVLGQSLPKVFLLVPIIMAVISLILAWYLFRFEQDEPRLFHKHAKEVKLSSPFELAPALKFGLIFILVLLAIAVGKTHFGDTGVYVAAVFSGLIDIDAIVISSLESLRRGDLSVSTTTTAIFIALIVNTFVKVLYVWVLGTRKLAGQVFKYMTVSSLIGVGFYFLLF